MSGQIIELDTTAEAAAQLLKLGVDECGIELMIPKAVHRVIKLKQLKVVPANILKQEMLSYGGDVATAYGAINHSVESTDVLIFGTLKQFQQLIGKLKLHQFGLPQLADQISLLLNNYELSPRKLKIGGQMLDLGRRTHIMGILNVTPDSFSDGGAFSSVEQATARAKEMLSEGADIIDVGGESTRPGADSVSAEEEQKRVLAVIERLAKETKALVSIDTTKARVARAALLAGAVMVNDVSCFRFDPEMPKVVAEFKVPVCLMHMKGQPQNMQQDPFYDDLIMAIIAELFQGLEIAKKAGILLEQIIIDPGIGFGKSVDHNLEIIRRLRELKSLGCPILVGPSRKSVIGQVLNLPVSDRLEGTAATVALAVNNGANLVRVHDVKTMARIVKMTDAIVRGKKNGEEKEKS